MEKIVLEIPTPKFKIGDLISRSNKLNDGKITLYIENIKISGTWEYPLNHGIILQGLYLCIIQQDSIMDHEGSTSTGMIPGRIIYGNIDFIDKEFELISKSLDNAFDILAKPNYIDLYITNK